MKRYENILEDKMQNQQLKPCKGGIPVEDTVIKEGESILTEEEKELFRKILEEESD